MLDTLTWPEFEDDDKKHTATEMDDEPGCIEIVHESSGYFENNQPVLYIRPINKSILDSSAKDAYSKGKKESVLKFKGFNSKEIKNELLREAKSRYQKRIWGFHGLKGNIYKIIPSPDKSKEFVAMAEYIHRELGDLD